MIFRWPPPYLRHTRRRPRPEIRHQRGIIHELFETGSRRLVQQPACRSVRPGKSFVDIYRIYRCIIDQTRTKGLPQWSSESCPESLSETTREMSSEMSPEMSNVSVLSTTQLDVCVWFVYIQV